MVAPADPSVSQRLAQRLCSLSGETLPSKVLQHARTLMQDTRMVAHAARDLPDVQVVDAMARATGGAGKSQLWTSGAKVPAAEAAFVNALAASALDYDSLHANVHPDAITLAAAWSVAESVHASGPEMLRAYVLGSEVVCRLADATSGPQKGWTIGAVLGTFGAAISASLVLRLRPEQMAHAMGLCLSMAAGSQQANVEQVLAKRLQPAFAARSGVHAALLAQAGMTAPSQVFEGRFGLWNLYFPAEGAMVLEGLGESYRMLFTGLKKYPVCACSHAAVDALQAAMAQAKASAREIARVDVRVSPFMDRLVGGPFLPSENPQVTAQFSLRYALASMALRGRLGLAEVESSAVLDPDIAAFVSRIVVVVDEAQTGELAPASVRLELNDGRTVDQTVSVMPGTAEAPLGEIERLAKFRECGWEDYDRLMAMLATLDDVTDLSSVGLNLKTAVDRLQSPRKPGGHSISMLR